MSISSFFCENMTSYLKNHFQITCHCRQCIFEGLLFLKSKISYPSGTCFPTHLRHEIITPICCLFVLMLNNHWFYSFVWTHLSKFHHFYGNATDNLKAYPLAGLRVPFGQCSNILSPTSASLWNIEINEPTQCMMESEHYEI